MKYYKRLTTKPVKSYLINLPKKSADSWIRINILAGPLVIGKYPKLIPHLIEHLFWNLLHKKEYDFAGETDLEKVVFSVYSKKKTLLKKLDIILNLFCNFEKNILCNQIKNEFKIIKNEILERNDDIPQQMFELGLNSRFSRKSLYKIQEPKELLSEKTNYNNVLSYYKKFWIDKNIEIFIGLNNADQEIIKKIKKTILKYKFQTGLQAGIPNPGEFSKFKIIKKNSKSNQISIALVWPGYRYKDNYKKRILLNLLRNILSTSEQSLLLKKLRMENSLTYWLYGQTIVLQKAGAINFSFQTDKNFLNKAIKIVIEEINLIKKGQINKKIFSKQLKEMLKNDRESWGNNFQRFNWIYSDLINEKKLISFDEVKKFYNKIQIQDVQKIAKEVFDNKYLNIIILGKNVSKIEIDLPSTRKNRFRSK